MGKFVKTAIVICTACEGSGSHPDRKKGYPTNSPDCPTCEGSGRLHQTTTLEWKPFKR